MIFEGKKIIDMHVHVFPDAIAPKAYESLTAASDGLKPYTDLTVSDTVEKMHARNISAFAALSIATKPRQCTSINNYMAGIKSDYILSFGTVHPDFEDPVAEIERITELGLYGVKLHPEYQAFEPDEARLFPIYKRLSELKLPVIFHAGWDPVSPDYVRATPQRLKNVAERFPDLKIICAHMGGMKLPDDAIRYLADTNVFIDTSMSCIYLSDEQFGRVLEAFGPDRVLFASDTPWSDPTDQLMQLERVCRDENWIERILHLNAESLLNVK